MRPIAIAALCLAAGGAGAEQLFRLSLDEVGSVSPHIEADADVRAEGAGSVRITTGWPATVSLGGIGGLDVEDARLVYSAKVRTELEGAAFLEMWVEVDGGRYFSKGVNDTVGGTTDWTTIEAPFLLGKGQRPEKVTLNLVINGAGTVWIDDIVLSREPAQRRGQ
ncbi:MAG: hypothetical protein PVF91_10530 [Chromatiales bacterium]|jgi:hypothetical protein